MKSFFVLSIILGTLFINTFMYAQAGQYGPFAVDEDNNLTLRVPNEALTKKYGEVFKIHKRDVTNISDWDGVLEQIIGEFDTDLLTESGVNFSTDDNVFTAELVTDKNVHRFMEAVKPTLSSVQKLDAFLTKLDKILKR